MTDQPKAKRSCSSRELVKGDEETCVHVRSAEGEDVRWPLWVALCTGTLKDWNEDTDGEGIFPAPQIPADALRLLLELCAHTGEAEAEAEAEAEVWAEAEASYPLPGSSAGCDACGRAVRQYYHCVRCREQSPRLPERTEGFDLCTRCFHGGARAHAKTHGAAHMLQLVTRHSATQPLAAQLTCISPTELTAVLNAANFLAASNVLVAVARELCRRFLAPDKSVDELRVALGVSKTESLRKDKQAAVLREPAFTPAAPYAAPSFSSRPQTRQCSRHLPVLQQSLLAAIDDDLLELVVHEADTATLCRLKAVSMPWLARARRALCARLCCREGHPIPTNTGNIESLNLEHLSAANRLDEAALAGCQLPNLTWLCGYGFEVDVAAVRKVEFDVYCITDDQRAEFSWDGSEDNANTRGSLNGDALRNCFSLEPLRDGALLCCGMPPREMLLAAVACAGSGAVFGIPLQELREDGGNIPIGELRFDDMNLTLSQDARDAAHLLALVMPGSKYRGGLTLGEGCGNFYCYFSVLSGASWAREGSAVHNDGTRHLQALGLL